ncbi:acetylornithine deacetylase [Pseudomonas sp. XS1P51]
MNTRVQQLLDRLIAFDTVSVNSNLDLIEYVRLMLSAHGIESTLVKDETGSKANLFASVGPEGVPGILLSGHTDVVPAAGQAWTVAPFKATQADGRIYGRGTCDMKGFIAVAIDTLLTAKNLPLKRPLQLALSYDEEIGCVGVRRLLDLLEKSPRQPFLCVVGEPTMMQFAVGHKGKTSCRVHCHGQEAHSSLSPLATNAIHLASDFVSGLRREQQRLASAGARDAEYDVPYTTLHVGTINGGKALNIVPNLCTLDFEIRNLPADDPQPLLDHLESLAESIAKEARTLSPVSAVHIETLNDYPGLDTSPTLDAVRLLERFVPPSTRRIKVAFGTEGGMISERLGVPVVVCGPGSIEQAHKPDEYVEISQLKACEDFLAKLAQSLC